MYRKQTVEENEKKLAMILNKKYFGVLAVDEKDPCNISTFPLAKH